MNERFFKPGRFAITVFLVCVASILLMSCGGLTVAQKNGINSFGDAAVELGDTVADQLPKMRDDVIEMNKHRYAIEYAFKSRRAKARASREAYYRKFDFDSGLDPENIEKRIKVANLLSDYGRFLKEFSEETRGRELNAASGKLVASMQEVPSDWLSKEQIIGLGKLVEISGSFFIERKKRKVIQKVVPMVSGVIQRLCDSLHSDFDRKQIGIAHSVNKEQNRLYSESLDGIKRSSNSPCDRLVQFEGFKLAEDSRTKIDRASDKVLKTVEAMRKANKELLQLVKQNNRIAIDDIKNFGKRANEMVRALKVFGK